ncbi:capsid cement protein [Erwinia amylovora]|uniref:capsid cement protein n=1 Tax=Erwinia amylovora TaxID=552 RepID=UPI001444737F|nr:capsid cement protein [Erwinia amylovora]
MATNYQQDGTTLDYQNGTAKAIQAGDAVAVGGIVGVAHDDIPAGLWGLLHTTGVFVLPKAAEQITAGQKLYLFAGQLTTAAGKGEATPGEEVPAAAGDSAANPLAGTAWSSAAADESTVAVRLGF